MAQKLNPSFIFLIFLIFLPYFFYMWHVSEIIQNVSILILLTLVTRFVVMEKVTNNRTAHFLVPRKIFMWNLAFAITWEKFLVLTRSLTSDLPKIVFLVFCLIFFQLRSFFSTRVFLFSNFWYFKLTFSVAFERLI